MGWSEKTQWADPVETLSVAYLETPEEAQADRPAAVPPPEPPAEDFAEEVDSPALASSKRRRRGKKEEVDEADIPPEILARRKKKAFQAKLIIYGTIGALTLAFLLVAAWRLPAFFPKTFPKGLPPWNLIFPEWYVQRERPHQLADGTLFYPNALQTRIDAARSSLDKARSYYSEAQEQHRDEATTDIERVQATWQRLQAARSHLAQVEEMVNTDQGLPGVDVLLGELRGIENRVLGFEGRVRSEAVGLGLTDLPAFDPLPPIPGQSSPPPKTEGE